MKNLNWLKYVMTALVVGGLILVGVKYLNAEEIAKAFARFNYSYLPPMLGLAALYLTLKSWRFVFLMSPVSDLAWGTTFRGYMAGQAATLVPGGVAARAGLMKQAGVPFSQSSAPVAYSSIIDQAVFIGCSLVAAIFFPAARIVALILIGLLVLLALIALIPLTRDWLLSLGDWIASKFNVKQKWRDFLAAMADITTPKLLTITVAMTVLAFGLKVVVLDLTLLGLDFDIAYPKLFLAYILPTMLGRLSGLPVGLGVTDAGMVGFITLTTGIDAESALAAVVIFRLATVAFEALLGAVVYFFFWKGEKEGKSLSSDEADDESGSSQPTNTSPRV